MNLSMTTTMSRTKLLETIEDNRAKHEKKYGEAVEAFWTKAEAYAAQTLDRIKDRDSRFLKLSNAGGGHFGGMHVQALLGVLGFDGDGQGMPVPPKCHLDDYDHAIRMVELNEADKVQLQAHDFQRLVMDQWEWTQDFNSSYMGLTG